jgi:anti-anti-sigma factor
MDIKINQIDDVTVVNLAGFIDYESIHPFKQVYSKYLQLRSPKKVLFNMRDLRFVGSSGIGNFLRTLQKFNSDIPNVRYCNVRTEFKRMFQRYNRQMTNLIVDSEEKAFRSFKGSTADN